jgi:purine-binding chemotaxis protein CheW
MSGATPPPGPTTSVATSGGQYLTFSLGREEYGIDILRVQEIRVCSAVTPIPNTPAWVRGVMNLRGAVIPVIDLRRKLGLDADAEASAVVVVVALGSRLVGLVVDAVSDVLALPAEAVQPRPEFGRGVDTAFLQGLARTEHRLVALLDLDRLLADDLAQP